MHNQLGQRVKIFAGVFPYKCGVVTLVFDNICYF
nr:MAG TPA: KOW2-KOW3 domains of Spt5, Spt5, RNA processing, Transcription [Caudoviricetes sp.]